MRAFLVLMMLHGASDLHLICIARILSLKEESQEMLCRFAVRSSDGGGLSSRVCIYSRAWGNAAYLVHTHTRGAGPTQGWLRWGRRGRRAPQPRPTLPWDRCRFDCTRYYIYIYIYICNRLQHLRKGVCVCVPLSIQYLIYHFHLIYPLHIFLCVRIRWKW